MSREAFMRSSGSTEDTSDQRFFTPVTPQDPLPSASGQPAQETIKDKLSPASDETKDANANVKPVESPTKAETSSEPVRSNATPEKAQPEARADVEVKTIIEAEQKTLTPEPKSEAQIVDAQLVELLGDDLKALGPSDDRKKPQADTAPEALAVGPEPRTPTATEPHAKVNGTSSTIGSTIASTTVAPQIATIKDEEPEVRENADPFAFDLGPSPFLRRSASERPDERKITVESAPSPQRALGPPRDDAPSAGERGWTKINGTPTVQEPVRPTAPPSKTQEPVAPVMPAATATRQTFAVPSVSATLGPHRRLEPLADSFKPAPSDYRKPVSPSADPFPVREVRQSAEPPFEPRRDLPDGRLQPAAPPLSALPPLSSSANPDVSGDRTMEDAVADLLRPLLKTWLAENMPKIVERALRREMTERLLPGQKNSHD
jgi:hypothetical protein